MGQRIILANGLCGFVWVKCGWAQVAANHTVADIMEEDRPLDDQCVGEVRRMQNA